MAGRMDGPLDGRGLPLIGQDAAREMLAALKELCEHRADDLQAVRNAWARARAAIAKAEGR